MRYLEYDVYGNKNPVCYLSPMGFEHTGTWDWGGTVRIEQRSAGRKAEEGVKNVLVEVCTTRRGRVSCEHLFLDDDEFSKLVKLFNKANSNLKVADSFQDKHRI